MTTYEAYQYHRDVVRGSAYSKNRKERFRVSNRLEFCNKLHTSTNIVANDNVFEYISTKEGVHNHVKEN